MRYFEVSEFVRNDYRDSASPKFNVGEPFDGVYNIQMNDAMARFLAGFILDVDGEIEREIHAFAMALRNPQKSRRLRDQKREAFRRERFDDREYQDSDDREHERAIHEASRR